MVVVALAGATTGFGLTMLKVFQHLNKQSNEPSHTIVVLSRKTQSELVTERVDVRVVDYTSHSSLVSALKGVDTVLSTIGGSGLGDSQLALLAAAKEAGVRRFAPSEYACKGLADISLYEGKAKVWAAVRESGLEYTRFSNGLFMSILATGTPKPLTGVGQREGLKTGEEEALAGLRPWNYVLNLAAGTADLAGHGTAQLAWTEMRDIAHYVWRALDLKLWPEDLEMRGDVKSFRELIVILEKVQARTFLVRETALETLAEEARDPSKQFYNQTRIAFEQGRGMAADNLNKAFPDIIPVSCEEFILKWWEGVQLGTPAWVEDKAFGAGDM